MAETKHLMKKSADLTDLSTPSALQLYGALHPETHLEPWVCQCKAPPGITPLGKRLSRRGCIYYLTRVKKEKSSTREKDWIANGKKSDRCPVRF